MLSTGKICEDIAKVVMAYGWESYIAYGRWAKPGVSYDRCMGNKLDMYMHYAQHRFFDREGLASRGTTKKLVRWIDEVKPDIIQLHNIHDHYLNYPILFGYLATLDTPIVWVQHDCWAYTGGCVYHDLYKCDKWREGCKGTCPNKRAIFCNKSAEQFVLKKELISKIKSLTFVSVSDWLGDLLMESFHKDRRLMTIHNGIDISRFRPLTKVEKIKENKERAESHPDALSSSIPNCRFSILGVAAVWDARKGLNDFIKLRGILSAEYKITLVGLTQKQVNKLPAGIRGITRISSIEEMVQLYSDSDVFVNSTYSDNFPTTNIEALACGTPVITYKTGGSPEAVDAKTGFVIKQGDIVSLANTIMYLKDNPFSSADCRKRAQDHFDKDKCFKQYIKLYNELLNDNR